MARSLPQKEQGLFKSLVRLYETKQLKKAVKTADQILKKFPQHGETLAMKGLAISQLDRKDEAYRLVREGLMRDMKSHICWHVYGLLYRGDQDYHEAAKAYLNALRLDPENQQILRDLALLQIQIRDYEGFEESRRKLLLIRPSHRANWLGVAVAFHLQGVFDQALLVLKTYQDTLDEAAESDQDPFERSELHLYKLSIFEEAKMFNEALEYLSAHEKEVLDSLAVRELRARLLASLNRMEEACDQMRSLLATNPDNHQYYRDLCDLAAKGKSAEEANEEAIRICDEMALSHPEAYAPGRIVLSLLSGEDPRFAERLDRYVRPMLLRGVPSLFSDIKALYDDSSRVVAIEQLFVSFLNGLKSEQAGLPKPPMSPDSTAPVTPDERSSPEKDKAALPWVLLFLSQHYDRVGDYEKALATVDEAIALEPDTVECLLFKARFLKHCGDIDSAVDVLDKARNMDLADRYVNTKCAKYALRANRVSQAEAWVSIFARDGDVGGVQALYEMQCMWFELEAAESHLRCGQYGPALKKFTAVERHFSDFVEDQFDFHTYCLRKLTLRSYVSMLRMEDELRKHIYYQRAAQGSIRCCLALEDMTEAEREATSGGMADVKGYASMSHADRKKALNKMKKRVAKKKGKASMSGANQSSAIRDSSPKPTANGHSHEGGPDKGKGQKSNQAQASGANKEDGTSGSAKNSSQGGDKSKSTGWMDVDPDGSERVRELLDLAVKNVTPLTEATKRIQMLEANAQDSIEVCCLGFEIAMRKKRYLQALRAARKARSIDAEHPGTLNIAIRLSHEIAKDDTKATLSPEVQKVLDAKFDLIPEGGIQSYIDSYITHHKDDPARVLGAYETKLWMCAHGACKPPEKEAAIQGIATTIRRVADLRGGRKSVSPQLCDGLLARCRRPNLNLTDADIQAITDAVRMLYPRAHCVATQ